MVNGLLFKRLYSALKERNEIMLRGAQELLDKRILIFTQCNNLSTQELNQLRNQLAQSKVSLKMFKTSIIRKAVEMRFKDDAGPEGHYQTDGSLVGLVDVLKGPLITWSSDSEPSAVGQAIISAIRADQKQRLHLIAGKIEDFLWTHEACREILTTFPSLQDQRSILLSILQSPAMSLNSILPQPPNVLSFLLSNCEKSDHSQHEQHEELQK